MSRKIAKGDTAVMETIPLGESQNCDNGPCPREDSPVNPVSQIKYCSNIVLWITD